MPVFSGRAFSIQGGQPLFHKSIKHPKPVPAHCLLPTTYCTLSTIQRTYILNAEFTHNQIETTVRDFHCLYYGGGLHANTAYHGIETHQCPLDLWIFQEILHETRPALVIELGTYLGGTTLFLAHQLELLGSGQVVSVDCRELPRPKHPRIQYVYGETQAPEVRERVRSLVTNTVGPVLVIHDADHRFDECLADLQSYGPFVTPGSYLIVEDTNVNGHPVLADWGPGPWEAVDQFLAEHPDFTRDTRREKFMLTYNPGGFLKRK